MMDLKRLVCAVVLAAVPWASSSAQNIEVPKTQGGQGSVNVGPGGQGSGGSVNSDVNRPATDPVQLKGSIDGYSAPSLKQDSLSGRSAPVVPVTQAGVPELTPVPTVVPVAGARTASPGTVEQSQARRPVAAPAAPYAQSQSDAGTPALKNAAPGAVDLQETVKGIKAGRKDGGVEGEAAIEAALDKVFEGARQAAKKTADSAQFGSVIGAMLRVESKIRRTVSVANTSSPHDAPKLYESAVETAKESLPAATAVAVGRAVLASADRKAETALPDLANEAVSQAAGGSAKGVTRALKSFDAWETLLGKPGQPLVGNLSHLKSFVASVLGGSEGRAVPVDGGAHIAAESLEGERGQAVASKEKAARGQDRIWFRRDSRTRTFQAVLPGSAVSPVPELALSFELSRVQSPFGNGEDAFAAFAAQPFAGNGFTLVYRTLRGAGVGRARSLLAAASYWAKTVLARAVAALKSFLRRSLSAGEAGRLAAEEAAEYAAAQSLLSRGTGTISSSAAEELFRRAGRMAAIHERLTGDSGGVGAVEDVRERLSGSLGRAEGVLSPSAARWLTGTDGYSLSYWIERIHSAVVLAAPQTGAGASGAWEGLSPSALDEGQPAAAAMLERLLSDVSERRQAAAAAASVLAALDSSPSRYTDLGRVGGLLAQGVKLRLKDGRSVVVTLLRDADMGRIAFARAETAGSSRSLSVKELAAALRVD